MDHFVKLERLPEGLRFPTELADRIAYDADGKRLVFHGFMSKNDFDRLWALSGDWTYRRQLEDLFRMSVPEEPSRPRGLRRLFASLLRPGPA